MLMPTPDEFADQLTPDDGLLPQVVDGLRGEPFVWDADEYERKKPLLKEVGITLVTKADIKNLGGVLHKYAVPVGSVCFPLLASYADVYVLECQVGLFESDTLQ